MPSYIQSGYAISPAFTVASLSVRVWGNRRATFEEDALTVDQKRIEKYGKRAEVRTPDLYGVNRTLVRPLTLKGLIAGGTGRTVILAAICCQIAKTWQVIFDRDRLCFDGNPARADHHNRYTSARIISNERLPEPIIWMREIRWLESLRFLAGAASCQSSP